MHPNGLGHNLCPSVSVLNVDRIHKAHEWQSEHIAEEVALATPELFACTEPRRLVGQLIAASTARSAATNVTFIRKSCGLVTMNATSIAMLSAFTAALHCSLV